MGCGQGASTWYLAREGFDVTSIDGSETALKKMAARLEKDKLTATMIHCDVVKLPCDDEEFDAVVDVICTAHNQLEDCKRIYSEVYRVLRKGGKMFSVVPHFRSKREPFMKYGPVYFFDGATLFDTLGGLWSSIELGILSFNKITELPHKVWIVSAVK